jgi:hypothetical protein
VSLLARVATGGDAGDDGVAGTPAKPHDVASAVPVAVEKPARTGSDELVCATWVNPARIGAVSAATLVKPHCIAGAAAAEVADGRACASDAHAPSVVTSEIARVAARDEIENREQRGSDMLLAATRLRHRGYNRASLTLEAERSAWFARSRRRRAPGRRSARAAIARNAMRSSARADAAPVRATRGKRLAERGGMRTRQVVGVSAVAVLLAPIFVFGLLLLIPAALLVVLALPLFGVTGATTLLAMAPDAEHASHGHPDATSAAGYAGL